MTGTTVVRFKCRNNGPNQIAQWGATPALASERN